MNSGPCVTLHDPTAPTVARKRGRPKRLCVEQTHKSSSLPQSSNPVDTDDSSLSVSCGSRPRKVSRKKDRHGQALMDTRPSLIVRLPIAGNTKSVPTSSSNPSQKEVVFSGSSDMNAPTAAPNNMYHRAGQLLSSGERIAPSATSSAIPSTRRDNTSVQAVRLSSGSRIAPTTISRVHEISDAREALKQIIRAKSRAVISSSQADTPMQAIPLERSGSNITQTTLPPATLRMTAAKRRAQEEELILAQAQTKSSGLLTPQGLAEDRAYLAALESAFRDAAFYKPGVRQQDASILQAAFQQEGVQNQSFEHQAAQPEPRHQPTASPQVPLYDQQPEQSAVVRRPALYQHHGHLQFDQPSAFQQPQRVKPMPQSNSDQAQRKYEELKRWQQSLWKDGDMM